MARPSPTVAALALTPNSRLCVGNFRRIAKRAKLSTNHVSRSLRGIRGLSFHVAKRIADAAGVTLDELYAHIRVQPGLIIKGRKTQAELRFVPKLDPIQVFTPAERKAIERYSSKGRLQLYKAELARRAKGTALTDSSIS